MLARTLMQLSRSSLSEIHLAQRGRAIHFGTGWKRQVQLTKDQQSVDNTARGDGNAEGRQR